MAVIFLRRHGGLQSLNNRQKRNIVAAMTAACNNNPSGFFRLTDNAYSFRANNINTPLRIDVEKANDDNARILMGLESGDNGKMFYAQLQAGHETYATIIYPQKSEMVQTATLITALQMSMDDLAIYAAIN